LVTPGANAKGSPAAFRWMVQWCQKLRQQMWYSCVKFN